MLQFSDRKEAGRLLASKLGAYVGKRDVIVLALPRGGVPVAFEIAERLRAPLDILVVRKVGFPFQRELAMGAVASGGVRVLDNALIRTAQLPGHVVDAAVAREEKEVEQRETLLRSGYPAQALAGRTVILVDDGVATGSTMLAAVEAVRMRNAREIVIAVPVASSEAYDMLAARVDKCVHLALPKPFDAVGQWYKFFPQVKDEEVRLLLSRSAARLTATESAASGSPVVKQ